MNEVVLCYHAVSPTWDHRLSIAPELLLRQVGAVRRFGPVHVTFDDAYRNIDSVLDDLLHMNVPVTVFVCTGFADRGGAPLTVPELATDDPDELAQLATMSWDQLRELAVRGVTVGSHTVSHPHLRRLSTEEVESELSQSKDCIEQELGRVCGELSYPYGEQDARIRGLARRAGYERAYVLGSNPGDPYEVPRVDLYRKHGVVRTLLKATLPYRVRTALT